MKENNIIIDNLLKLINKAEPSLGKIYIGDSFKSGDCLNTRIILYNNNTDYLEINIVKNKDAFYVFVSSNTGIKLNIDIKELDFLKLKSAVINCLERYNISINSFCEKFYD